jgi:hypothetical protein
MIADLEAVARDSKVRQVFVGGMERGKFLICLFYTCS